MLEAGGAQDDLRELDKRVAKALGWRVVNPRSPDTRRVVKKWWELVSPFGGDYTGWHKSEESAWSICPRFSSEPKELTRMLEWARDNYSLCLFATCPLSSVLNCWVAHLTSGVYPPVPMEPEEGDIFGYGDTPQLAVARAVAAVGSAGGERWRLATNAGRAWKRAFAPG